MKKIFYLFLLFSSSLFAQHLGEIPVNSDLGGYYHFNGNSTDATSNANNGTGVDITYGLANGKFGQGAYFNGTSSQITANGLLTTLKTSTTGTISFWFNNIEISNTRELPISMAVYTPSISGYFFINLDWTTAKKWIAITCYSGTAIQWEVNTTTNSLIPLTNIWNNLVLTHDGTTPLLYLNGTIMPITFNVSTNKTIWFNSVMSGVHGAGSFLSLSHPTLFYKGKLDEVIVTKSKVWSASDVRKYYTQSKGRFTTLQQ